MKAGLSLPPRALQKGPARSSPDNNLKLVHVSGNATTDEVLTDPTFGVSATAIRLGRKVEMYQWNEVKNSSTQKDLGGSNETTTTYSYVKKWSDDPIDSTKFKEAAATLNFSYLEALRHVILPQSWRVIVPPTFGFLVLFIKDTALASQIGVMELTSAGKVLNDKGFSSGLVYGVGLVSAAEMAACSAVGYFGQ